jgi:hypothetical protein
LFVDRAMGEGNQVRTTMYEFRCFLHSLKTPINVIISVRPSVRYSRCISAIPTGGISVKFDIVIFYENLWRNYRFGYNRAEHQALYMTS